MNPHNLKVGDKLYYKTIENQPEIGYTKVTVIGRKYFQVKGSYEKFNLDNPFGRDRRIRFYPDEQCYLDECEKNTRLLQLQEYFGFSGKGRNLSLDQLRQINQIIEGNQNEIC